MAPEEKQKPHGTATLGRRLVALLRSWFELTTEEQLGLLIILGLFLLGLVVHYWRMLHESP
ncbi:MAG: hypothetical protein ACUVWX_09175 [Kiritimatiellia bacterium]